MKLEKGYNQPFTSFYLIMGGCHQDRHLHLIGGKMNRGKLAGGQFKISGLDLSIMTSQRDIESLKSWPIDELCEKTAKHLEIY